VLARRAGRAWVAAGFAACAAAACAGRARAAGADTVYVDTGNPNCRSSAKGTATDPYCTISSAISAHHAPGTVLLVRPGTYREQVTIPASGVSGDPITLLASPEPDSPVVIDGADAFGSPGLWAPAASVWLASSVTWSPNQVRAHGARLAPWSGTIANMPVDAWKYVAGTGLYVNVGTDPATQDVRVGRRSYGFYLPNREYVHIEGFTILEPDDRGILLTSGAEHIEIVNNVVRWAARIGIQAVGATDVRIAGNVVTACGDYGISLISGTTGCTIEGNESSYNVYAPERRANGLYLFGSPANVIRGNRWHHNQDSGQDIESGSNDVISIQNVSWANGDHGFDHLHVTGSISVGDVAYGNYRDGFSFEGFATGCQLHNCIAVENGLETNEVDLWVDDDSMSGFSSDDNVFWNSTSQPPIKQGSTRFSSVTAWAAWSGADTRTLQLDPLFVDPANGDFRLRTASPAIDNANSDVLDWPLTDATGMVRLDDPQTPNLGRGPVPYADRGAYEFIPEPTTAVDGSIDAPGGSVRIEPNPMRAGAEILFRTSRPGPLRVSLLDLAGRCVRTLEAPVGAGAQRVTLEARAEDGRPLEAGVYFVRVSGPDGDLSGRVLVLR
jgi:parallel beta-helix repeat protein